MLTEETLEDGDGEWIAVALIGEHELALVVGAPEIVGLGGDRQRRTLGFLSPRPAVINEAVPIKGGMDGADGR